MLTPSALVAQVVEHEFCKLAVMCANHIKGSLLDVTTLDRKEASKHGMQYWVITARQKTAKQTAAAFFHANIRCGVAASSVENAIVAVKKIYPDCNIVGVSHQGPIEIQGD